MKILKIPSIPMSKIIRLIKIITLFKRKQQMQIQRDFSSNLLILSVNSIFYFKKKSFVSYAIFWIAMDTTCIEVKELN